MRTQSGSIPECVTLSSMWCEPFEPESSNPNVHPRSSGRRRVQVSSIRRDASDDSAPRAPDDHLLARRPGPEILSGDARSRLLTVIGSARRNAPARSPGTHEECSPPFCSARVAAREAHGGQAASAPSDPARKSLEDFDHNRTPGPKKEPRSPGPLSPQRRLLERRPARPTRNRKTRLATGLEILTLSQDIGSCSPPPDSGSTGSPRPDDTVAAPSTAP